MAYITTPPSLDDLNSAARAAGDTERFVNAMRNNLSLFYWQDDYGA